jgi:hypothetical protein
MSKEALPYYPPRARWYSPLFSLGHSIRRGLALDRIRLPAGVTVFGLLAGILVPGVAVYLKGPRLWGRLAMVSSAVLASVFIIWLGHRPATWAFGLLLSVHSTGLLYYLGPLLADMSFGGRVFCAVGMLAVLGFTLYLPLGNMLENRFFMPLAVRGQVVVIDKHNRAKDLKRGDMVAYTVAAANDRVAYVMEGFALGRVLALAGDRVSFLPDRLEINGRTQSRRDRMPTAGEMVVPEDSLFIWPELDISIRGQVPEGNVTGALMEMAVVSAKQVLGKPFKRWFWRAQMPS